MNNNWSIETIQETAGNGWSLEGDNQLLNLMKSISKNLEQRCMTSTSKLNRLMLDVDKTKIKLGNATTKLLDLNNGKFVEHTVMDMDSSVSNAERSAPTESDKTLLSLPKSVEEAVTNGLTMMDRCYEKVLLNLEDSDDEEENDNGQKHVVCRPKNPYQDRPLPHLIGSKQWNEKWHVGLIESDEEVLSDEEPEEEPEFSSDEGDLISNSPRTSNPPTTSESDFAVPIPSAVVVHHEDLFHRLADDDDDADTKSPLFTPTDTKHRERVKVLPTIDSPIQNDAKSEPTNKTKQLTEPPVPAFEQPKQSIFVQQKSEPKFLNLFDDEPPSLEEPIRHERKPVNLFLDSDDEDVIPAGDTKKPSSIFNNNVASQPTTLPFSIPQLDNAPRVENVPKVSQARGAFKGDVENNNVPAVAKSAIKPTTLKSNDFGGLFDDEPPDDFFDIIVREQRGKNVDNRNAEKPKLQSKTVNLFNSDDDDDDFSKIIGTIKANPHTLVSSKESAPVVKPNDISYSPFNSPFRSLKNNDPPKSYVSFLDDEPPVVDDDKKETYTTHPPSSRTNLFDDTPPDDIFAPAVQTKPKPPTKIIYDDIAATLREQSSSTAIISSGNSKSEATNHPIVKTPPVALPRKPELIQRKIVDQPKATGTDEIPVSSKEPKLDVSTRDETDQSLSFRKNLNMFTNPVATALPIEKESKPKPNKLKTNFNINVAALLPGAKLPSQKQSTTEKPDPAVPEPDPEPEQIKNVDNVIPASKVKQIDSSVDTSGRLTSLSKNRARIQVQRKPSTRKGRQKLYNKTQMSEEDNMVEAEETTDSVRSEITTDEKVIDIVNPENDKESDVENHAAKSDVVESENVAKSDLEANDWLDEDLIPDQTPPPSSNDSTTHLIADDDEEEEDWLKNIDEKPPSPIKTSLYDDDWLSTKQVHEEPKPSAQTMSHVINYDWLTASSLPPEDINPPSNYSIDDHEQDDWLTSYVSKEKSTVVADLPNDDDDWLITAQETSRETSSGGETKDEEIEKDWLLEATLEPAKNISKKTDDNDDDWLTKSLVPPKVSTIETDEVPVSDKIIPAHPQIDRSDTVESSARQTHKSTLFDSEDENTAKEELTRSKSKIEPKKFLSSTIFDDDDDDDVTAVPSYLSDESKSDAPKRSPPKMDFAGESSDIFKPKSETKKSLNSTLFDDDDNDGDDDLFASIKPKTSSAKQTTTEASKTTKQVSIKAKSLFSDDDNSDPDDLFGPKATTKKQKATTKAGPKTKIDKPKKTSLFDDEDDDDDEDIFAPKTQKRVTNDSRKKSSVTKSVATIPASSDPLADLLK